MNANFLRALQEALNELPNTPLRKNSLFKNTYAIASELSRQLKTPPENSKKLLIVIEGGQVQNYVHNFPRLEICTVDYDNCNHGGEGIVEFPEGQYMEFDKFSETITGDLSKNEKQVVEQLNRMGE